MTERLDPEPLEVPIDESLEPPPEAPRPRTRSVRTPGRKRQSTGRKPATRTRKPSPAKSEPSAEEALRGLLQLPAAGFILIGQQAQSIPLVADGATILVHGGPFAAALATICENDPRLMALLEKVIAFGPYGEALALGLPLAAQFVRNHNEAAAPILSGFGAVSAEEIILRAELTIPEPISPNGQRPEPNGSQAADSPPV